MARKNGAAKQAVPEPELPRHFSFRPPEALNVEIREYLITNAISFNDLCRAAIIEYLVRHRRWPKHDLHLPRGKRPRAI